MGALSIIHFCHAQKRNIFPASSSFLLVFYPPYKGREERGKEAGRAIINQNKRRAPHSAHPPHPPLPLRHKSALSDPTQTHFTSPYRAHRWCRASEFKRHTAPLCAARPTLYSLFLPALLLPARTPTTGSSSSAVATTRLILLHHSVMCRFR